ncbi:MAG: ShlB/FhaC/HecB family hemolysin secretion/activation protein [Pseudomonadota bacterium]
MIKGARATYFFILSILMLAAQPLVAQETPGTVNEALKAQPTLEAPKPAPKIEAPRRAKGVAPAGGKKIKVKKFVFKGNTVFSSKELSAQIKDYTQRKITLLEIYDAADLITQYYVDRGYALASANVPAQKVDGGTIKLEIIEGKVGVVGTDKNEVYSGEQIKGYVDLPKGTLYTSTPLENALKRLNELPGLAAKAVIKPGEDYGTSDLIIQVQESRFGASATVDNHGRRSTGRTRYTLAGALNNPLQLGDQLQIVKLLSEGSRLDYTYGGYNVPLSVHGPRLYLSYGKALFKVLGAAPIEGISETGRAYLEQVFLRSDNQRLSATAGYTRIVSNVNALGVPVTATNVTVYDFGATYNQSYSHGGVTQYVASIATDFQDQARADCAPAPGSGCKHQPFKFSMNVQHLQPIYHGLEALVRFDQVFSADILPDSTAFSAGGPNGARGYASAEIRGDEGYSLSVDFRYGINVPYARVTPRVFVDYAAVNRHDAASRALTESDAIGDYGVGLDVRFPYNVFITADYAQAMTRGHLSSDGGNSHQRIFAKASVNF